MVTNLLFNYSEIIEFFLLDIRQNPDKANVDVENEESQTGNVKLNEEEDIVGFPVSHTGSEGESVEPLNKESEAGGVESSNKESEAGGVESSNKDSEAGGVESSNKESEADGVESSNKESFEPEQQNFPSHLITGTQDPSSTVTFTLTQSEDGTFLPPPDLMGIMHKS
jgi:hypothetical protein